MDFVMALLGFFSIVGLIAAFVFIGYYGGRIEMKSEMEKELFERGHMIQCLGKSGYYWECEDAE